MEGSEGLFGDIDWFGAVIGPALVSILIGVSTGYTTAKVTLATHTEQIQQNTQNIKRINREMNKVNARSRVRAKHLENRLTSLETKIDLLLNNQLQLDTNPDPGSTSHPKR